MINDYTYATSVPDPNIAGATDSSFFQIANAHIYGLEADYEQQFTFLPGFLSGFGLKGNVVLNSSLGTDHPNALGGPAAATALPGECPLEWNVGSFYRTNKWDFSLNCAYTAPYVVNWGVGTAPSGDVYQDEFYSVNAKLQYAINKNFKVYVEGRNLINQPYRLYQGQKSELYDLEYDGPSFDAGLNFTF